MPNFTVYLIKNGYELNERYVLDGNNVVENRNSIFNDGVTTSTDRRIHDYIIRKDINIRRILKSQSPNNVYYRESDSPNPWWKTFWHMPENLSNKSTDILSVLSVAERLFIVTHGQARFLINPLTIEYDFGLRTALNMIDEGKIKSADLFTPSEIALRTRKHSGKNTSIDNYDINIYNSLLKNVAGMVKTEYTEYFISVDGADNIKFNLKGDIGELETIVEQLFECYSLEDYQDKGFGWIDNFKAVKDKIVIDELDSILISSINDHSEDIILTFPEVLDKAIPIYYRYCGIVKNRRDVSTYPFLDIKIQYYEKLIQNHIEINLDDLKRQQLIAVNMNNNNDIYSLKIYQCIYFETDYNGNQFFLESGTWYHVDRRFMFSIQEKIDNLVAASRSIDFNFNIAEIGPESVRTNKNKEYIFNERFSEYLNGFGLSEVLDSELVTYNRSQIEICDVIFKDSTNNIILFHNKYKYGSSALSHLFSQGYVSAELLTETGFRALANEKIVSENLKFSHQADFSRSNIIVIYGIISKKNRNGSFTIPLFSKINLDMFYKNLHLLNYHVEVVFIEAVDN